LAKVVKVSLEGEWAFNGEIGEGSTFLNGADDRHPAHSIQRPAPPKDDLLTEAKARRRSSGHKWGPPWGQALKRSGIRVGLPEQIPRHRVTRRGFETERLDTDLHLRSIHWVFTYVKNISSFCVSFLNIQKKLFKFRKEEMRKYFLDIYSSFDHHGPMKQNALWRSCPKPGGGTPLPDTIRQFEIIGIGDGHFHKNPDDTVMGIFAPLLVTRGRGLCVERDRSVDETGLGRDSHTRIIIGHCP